MKEELPSYNEISQCEHCRGSIINRPYRDHGKISFVQDEHDCIKVLRNLIDDLQEKVYGQ